MFDEYVKPELLILIPVLNIAGEIIKQSKINDKYIPLILGVIGIILSSTIIISASEFTVQNLVAGIIQGILIAGTSVYADQIVKQVKK